MSELDLRKLSHAQQHGLAVLQIQAGWFGQFFMRQADRLVGSINPGNDL